MISEKPLRAENLRIHNKSLVLSLIHQYRSAGISQSVIVEKTGLKAPTILRIFNELLEDDVIEPVNIAVDDNSSAKKGRRPINFCVKRTARYSVAIEFWSECLSVGIFDFWGEIVQNITYNLKSEMAADDIIKIAVSAVKSGIKAVNVSYEKIMGIGIAAPGQVDLVKNIITYYPRIQGMQNYPIVENMQKYFDIPVILNNNCSAFAAGQLHYGNLNVGDSLFTFLIRSGINGSFICDDTVFVNSRHRTIEVGHIPIAMDGPPCVCGKKGCLEACLRTLTLHEKSPVMFGSLDLTKPAARQIMDKASRYLCAAVHMFSQIFSPSAFLVAACDDAVASMLTKYLREKIQKDFFSDTTPTVLPARYDPLFALQGIRDQVISHYFEKMI